MPHAFEMKYNEANSAARMVASYGVYNDATLRVSEDEDCFIPRTNYHGVVVNAAGDSSVARPAKLRQASPAGGPKCGWCTDQSATPDSSQRECFVFWCRPTMLLLVLVLLVVVFVLVSGILLYYNCMLVDCFACL